MTCLKPQRTLLSIVIGAVVLATPALASAGEGGTSHITPRAKATLIDNPPTGP